jgi:hypothetical protein
VDERFNERSLLYLIKKKKKFIIHYFIFRFLSLVLLIPFIFIAKKYKQQLEEITFNYVIALVGEEKRPIRSHLK